jgi:hypothetical protein
MVPTAWLFIAFLTGLALGGLTVWRWLDTKPAEEVPKRPQPATAPDAPEPAGNEIAAYLDANQRVVDELQRKYAQGPPPEPETRARRAPRKKPVPRRKP